ncbi:hormone-sensitive lipase isoform X1 [Varanus komodoensis]|uniref:hormone-sensitive lipase isoform X1 n=2 Tax=Varanus komodoensis TaxID=61221 RepID=UPI001CF7AC6C|nr:hormone-sensitive lipase isoform X1 [Varanus komodoensis]XP_044290923.1 hormone-sensitive lipase isoform X1 [Varanus komodoensis]XP_044290924.1 hormone-sensitive lipase isoform X1 [Varanus komodoensis]XP_044290925.1 hormone-sensitive lipase isoform X1 [Varanus komodoensis]XP_044290926.1 hormone-sensitive lipase isoform X1 [Varanus komodoensis]XP_044290927.1 hormone-sensitive lipase isoform X1 [Varanus komodoensis]XP_044290928.1 hormone-sensitive lipase isoform X1 [Varanus komodoensis]
MRASNLHGEEREAEAGASGSMECVAEAVAEQCPMASSSLDSRPLFQTLYNLVDSNVAFFQDGSSDTGRRFLASFLAIREHAQHLEPVLSHFATIFHIFDLDERTPANGYRSLAHIVHCCLAHIIHKSHYVATNRHSIFFRASHNCAELEAYCSALTQLRALVYLAQSLLTHNQPGYLFSQEGEPLSELLLQEYVTMHKGCFYGRCMGFQFAPSIRPFLQTIAISLVSFGENYKRHVSGIGVMAGSICTSGKFVIDPELRGLAFERTTQNLDVHFWKSFWNLTEMELLVSLASMGSSQVRLSRPLLVPPHSFELPLAADPKLTVTITPPVAHSGPGPVQMRLISHELREGQDSEELNNLLRPEVTLALELRWKTKLLPRSPYLVVHFHGGGFVAQTSKSHEPYLKIWAQELGAPILSIDYSLSPEAPFPRALEECFYAYCWALRNCHLLGSTAERVCLAGDSAGGNLCITVSMRAAAVGIRMPDGIMAAYPVTLLQAVASPSRLLTLFDPLLPLSVLCKCLNAYAGIEEEPEDSALVKLSPMNVRRDTALIFRDLRLSASALFGSRLENTSKINGAGGASGTVRKSVSEGGLKSKPLSCSKDSCKSQTCQNLSCTSETPLGPGPGPSPSPGLEPQPGFSSSNREHEATSSTPNNHMTFPDGFRPLHSDQPAIHLLPKLSPILKNPFVSPLLAPDEMLKGLPPIHIVACALDPMLDESVMFARRLRTLGQPVTLRVVQDLPHGFLSLSHLSRETREALAVCTESIRDVLTSEAPAACQAPTAAASPRKHRKVERTFPARPAPSQGASHAPAPETGQEGLNGAAPSTTDNAAPDPQEPRSTSPGEPPSGAGGGAVPTRSPSSEAAVTPGQDCSPSGGTVGRGVGA